VAEMLAINSRSLKFTKQSAIALDMRRRKVVQVDKGKK
jgi:hypothetical protein